jgi:nitrogen regulatory protein PII 1
MVEILAVVRKEKSYEVSGALADKGINYVSWTVKGRGKEGGLRYKGLFRERVVMPFLPKRAFLIHADKNVADKIVEILLSTAYTGAYGDGKVFLIDPREEVTKMKLIKAIIRPERVYEVIKALEKKGYKAMTMWDVVGRGKEGGVQVGKTCYDELAKTVLMIAVEDKSKEEVIETIIKKAHTGAYGDGKIFVTGISEVWTIRTKDRGL